MEKDYALIRAAEIDSKVDHLTRLILDSLLKVASELTEESQGSMMQPADQIGRRQAQLLRRIVDTIKHTILTKEIDIHID